MSTQLSIVEHLVQLEVPFSKQNSYGLTFATECLFAKQQLLKNDYTLKTAENNTQSLRNAILNVAAIGVSLNPATAHAYLVPRDGQICLDISYKGLVKLATDSGAIEWAKPILVYDGDTFEYLGPCTPPNHVADVFGDRGKPVGGYCIARLKNDYMVDVMPWSEIEQVRNTSKAKNGPWKTWPLEMAKKTLVKRASKSWPQSSGRDRLDQAVSVLNEHEGLAVEARSTSEYMQASPEQEEKFRDLLGGEPLDYFLWWKDQDERIQMSLGSSFPKGEKGKGADLMRSMKNSGQEMFIDLLADLTTACENEDDMGAIELLQELSANQAKCLQEALSPALVSYASKLDLS